MKGRITSLTQKATQTSAGLLTIATVVFAMGATCLAARGGAADMVVAAKIAAAATGTSVAMKPCGGVGVISLKDSWVYSGSMTEGTIEYTEVDSQMPGFTYMRIAVHDLDGNAVAVTDVIEQVTVGGFTVALPSSTFPSPTEGDRELTIQTVEDIDDVFVAQLWVYTGDDTDGTIDSLYVVPKVESESTELVMQISTDQAFIAQGKIKIDFIVEEPTAGVQRAFLKYESIPDEPDVEELLHPHNPSGDNPTFRPDIVFFKRGENKASILVHTTEKPGSFNLTAVTKVGSHSQAIAVAGKDGAGQ